jgi:hypothetical protein
MKTIGKKLVAIGFMVLFLTSFGCAFGTRNVTLNPMKTSLTLDASGQKASLEVTDKRDPALKPVVGHVKNGYGMKTAQVVADKDVSLWVRDAIGRAKENGGIGSNRWSQFRQ